MRLYVRGRSVRGRGLTWSLTLTEFKTLVTAPCWYCGKPPDQEFKSTLMRRQAIKRNGIDRVDNTIGYTLANCVSCCTTCNREKGSQTKTQFIENTRRRFEHLKRQGLL